MRTEVSSPDFSWVYDCGTTSSQDLINDSLMRLENALGGSRPILDLVIISHFDKDHISGISKLLGKFNVRTLVIPLVPLWQRLSLLFNTTRYVEKNALPFYLDPVAAISRVEGARIERIVLVPPSGGDGPPEQRASDNAPQPNLADDGAEATGDQGSRLELKLPLGSFELFDGDDESSGTYNTTKVYRMPPGESMSCNEHFEFIPYNDADLAPPPSSAFIASVAAKAKVLLSATSDVARTDALKKLKREYEATYKRPEHRNAISLYMYAGPVGARKAIDVRRLPCFNISLQQKQLHGLPLRHCPVCWGRLVNANRFRGCSDDCANILYTGDGFLTTPMSWTRLAGYLGPSRTTPLLAFQVMHHGSSKNWHEKLASGVRAQVAIFSSDPDHRKFKHPHNNVVDDFEAVSIVARVNKSAGYALVRGVA